MYTNLQKVLFLDSAWIFTLFFLQSCTLCFSREEFQESSPSISFKQHDIKVDAGRATDIAIHGIMLWASMGLLMPAGMLAIRLSTLMEECDNKKRLRVILFYVHAILQVVSVVVATAGAVLSIKSFENRFNNNHQRIGLALHIAIYVQFAMGFCRPKRKVWYFFHWLLGTTTSLAGIINTYTGLRAYHEKTSKSISLWVIIFTAQVSFMGFFYLFQDKWEYIQKQSDMIVANEPVTRAVVATTEVVVDAAETYRRSNALGAYFSRSKALNKLLQQTSS